MDTIALIYILAPLLADSTAAGPLSIYAPNDGHNSGQLACGGTFARGQRHIAHRRWRKLGCGRPVLVVSKSTGRYAMATVRDAGPFGVVEVLPKSVKRKPRWKVWTRSLKAPPGWRWRGEVDLSYDLWLDLGKPRFLSHVTLYFLPRGILEQAEDLLRSNLSSSAGAGGLPTSSLDQLSESLEHMKLRGGPPHQAHPPGGDADLLGHRTVVEPEQIYASHQVPSHARTVPRLYVPYCPHATEYGIKSLANQVWV